MKFYLRISLLLAIIIYFIILFNLLNKKRLNLKYTLLWFLLGIIMLILLLFPNTLDVFNIIGIIEPINGLFSTMLFCILMILMSITAIVSKLNEKNKILVQVIGALEKRIREIEQKDEEKLN